MALSAVKTPIIPEEDLRRSYLEALSRILARKAACLAACREKLAGLEDLSALWEKRRKAEESLEKWLKELQALVLENARRSQDQQQYRAQYEKLAGAAEAAEKTGLPSSGRMSWARLRRERSCAGLYGR